MIANDLPKSFVNPPLNNQNFMKSHVKLSACVCAALFGASANPVAAQTIYNWSNNLGGNWSVPANWGSVAGAPPDVITEAAVVPILTGGAFTITLDLAPNIDSFDIQDTDTTFNLNGQTMTVATTFTNSGTVTNTGTIAAAGSIINNVGGLIRLDNNQSLTTVTPTITNNGTIINSGIGNFTDLRLSGNTTINGSGTIMLGNNVNNRLFGHAGNGTERITNNSTIQGGGQIGVNVTKLTNNGTIIANLPTALVFDPTDGVGDAVNTGTLRAASGGTLILGLGQYTNAGGTIEALDASVVDIRDGARIIGGTLTTAGTGVIGTANGFELQNVTNNGLIRINNNQFVTLLDTFRNDGVVELNSIGNFTDIRFATDTTITGTGTLRFSNNQFANRIISSPSGNLITIGSGQTIEGSFSVGYNVSRFINNGLIN